MSCNIPIQSITNPTVVEKNNVITNTKTPILPQVTTAAVTKTEIILQTQTYYLVPTITPSPTLQEKYFTSSTPKSNHNELTSGADTWQLISFEILKEIDALGYTITPAWQNYPITYNFLFLKFECVSGKSLIELYTGKDMGLTFIHNANGFQDVYILDNEETRHPITMLGDCWMAAPIAPEKHSFTLQFQNFEPLELSEKQPLAWRFDQILFVFERNGNPDIVN